MPRGMHLNVMKARHIVMRFFILTISMPPVSTGGSLLTLFLKEDYYV
jgi:hypothetical protein